MVTKAELEAELAALKAQLATKTDAAAAGTTNAAQDAAETGRTGIEDGKAALADFLKSHGIDSDTLDLDALWQQVSDQAGALTRKQPALALVAIFALGFILGRVSK